MKNQIIYEDKYLNIKNNFLSKLTFDKNLIIEKKKNWTNFKKKKTFKWNWFSNKKKYLEYYTNSNKNRRFYFYFKEKLWN